MAAASKLMGTSNAASLYAMALAFGSWWVRPQSQHTPTFRFSAGLLTVQGVAYNLIAWEDPRSALESRFVLYVAVISVICSWITTLGLVLTARRAWPLLLAQVVGVAMALMWA